MKAGDRTSGCSPDLQHVYPRPQEETVLTAHVGVVDHRFAPQAAALVLVGADSELIRRVGLQVVHHRVVGRAGLVVPFAVPLPVADGVEPAAGGQRAPGQI